MDQSMTSMVFLTSALRLASGSGSDMRGSLQVDSLISGARSIARVERASYLSQHQLQTRFPQIQPYSFLRVGWGLGCARCGKKRIKQIRGTAFGTAPC